MTSSGIRFNDCVFSEPVELAAWTPPRYAGLVAILVSDPNWAPRAYQPVYFGEFGNNSPSSGLLDLCKRVAAATRHKSIFVAELPMPFSTTQQRWTLCKELVWAYNPLLQTGLGPESHKPILMDGIEAPLRRRPIGFIPPSQPSAD